MSDPALIRDPIRDALLAEAIAALEALRAWYVAHGDTRAPLAPWVDAGKLVTRLRALKEQP